MLVVEVAGMPAAARSSMVAVLAEVLPGILDAVGYKTLLALGTVVGAVGVVVVAVNMLVVDSGTGAAVAAVTVAADMYSGPVVAGVPGWAVSLFCCSCRVVAALDSECPLQDRSKYRVLE